MDVFMRSHQSRGVIFNLLEYYMLVLDPRTHYAAAGTQAFVNTQKYYLLQHYIHLTLLVLLTDKTIQSYPHM